MDNCIECENETMLKYSSLSVDYYEALEQIKLLKDSLKATQKLCDFYSNRCEELENKVKIYQNKIEEEKEVIEE